ncbi:MAG: hypothetical protein HY695_28065 [Deltaproteobacteria bacterium]|nr:hypothetical protein [Deltaproteobacteria bacterium]
MIPSSARVTILALAFFILTGAAAKLPPKSGVAPLELYVLPDRTFALYKPPGWQVSTQDYPNGRTVMVVAPREHAFAQMTFLKTDDRGNDSV